MKGIQNGTSIVKEIAIFSVILIEVTVKPTFRFVVIIIFVNKNLVRISDTRSVSNLLISLRGVTSNKQYLSATCKLSPLKNG